MNTMGTQWEDHALIHSNNELWYVICACSLQVSIVSIILDSARYPVTAIFVSILLIAIAAAALPYKEVTTCAIA